MTTTTMETMNANANGMKSTDAALRTEDVGADDTVPAEVFYLIKDPKHDYEKPYVLRFNTKGQFPSTNMETDPTPINIRNFRSIQDAQSFENYGFTLMKLDCPLTATEFEDPGKVEQEYYPTLENLLWKMYPNASEVRILQHEVRIHNSIAFERLY
jgi:hypothetical protein